MDYMMVIYSANHMNREALGFEMVVGEYFIDDLTTDSSAIVSNQMAAEKLDWENSYRGSL